MQKNEKFDAFCSGLFDLEPIVPEADPMHSSKLERSQSRCIQKSTHPFWRDY